MARDFNVNWREIPHLEDIVNRIERTADRMSNRMASHSSACNGRKYHVASKRITQILLLGGSVEQTLTWSAPFDNTNYAIEWALFDLEGQATITELSRTTSTVTVRVTGGVASIALGATYMAFGRSL